MTYPAADLSWQGRAGPGSRPFLAVCDKLEVLVGLRVEQVRHPPQSNVHLESSFLPSRSFAGSADSTPSRRRGWAQVGQRCPRRLDRRSADRCESDKAPMLPLPPVDPVTGWRRRGYIASTIERLRGRYARVRVGPGPTGSSESRGTVLNVVHS
jgi:hypothetical protein